MSVWFCIPSIRPAAEARACLNKWKAMGYSTAVLRQGEPIEADLLIPTGEYLGWSRSTNILAREVLREDLDPHAMNQWIVAGGDDYLPDMSTGAETIAEECSAHFSAMAKAVVIPRAWYGVMQPTGDRWGDSESARMTYGENRGAILERVAGSPWMGREWCKRAYLGNGPMWDGYHHLYADEELQAVAEQQGVFWQRPDLTQYHAHPARVHPGGYQAYREGHLAALYSDEAWAKERAIFEDRKKKGFPGSEPCPR